MTSSSQTAKNNCSCWYGSYIKTGGGTGFDIARYDPDCPEHGGKNDEQTESTDNEVVPPQSK